MSTSASRRSSGGASIRNVLSSQVAADSISYQQQLKKKPQMVTPQIIEYQLGESIQARTNKLQQIHDVGPADLIHISKYHRHNKEEMGEYHYCVGLDTSSIIQPFMYLQTLLLNDKHTATDKHPKVGTYCAYNCFRHGDLRIRYTFPGTTAPQVQFIPNSAAKGMINVDTDEDADIQSQLIWKETYVSCLVRALMFCDETDRQLPGMCKLNPVQSTKDAKEAVTAICQMLPRGYLLNCDDLINLPTLTNNHLVDALFKLLSVTGYYDLALAQIARLEKIHPRADFSVLKVRLLLRKDNQIEAVKLMHETLKKNPRNGWMLREQAQFVIQRNRPDMAIIPASRSVECLPTEFTCWHTLIKAYILTKDYRNALLSLNSAPMYSNKKKDIYAAIRPHGFEFPLPAEGRMCGIWEDAAKYGCVSGFGGIVEFSGNSEVSTVGELHLQVYEQTKLQCTFKEAYDVLAILSRRLGWSELLKLRSELFVMEDEYNASMEAEQQRTKKKNQRQQQQRKHHPEGVDGASASASASAGDASTSYSSTKSSQQSISRISTKFKRKRLSERWLDSLFLIFYENLKSVMIWENECQNGAVVSHPALEWELIGNECFKVRHFESGISPYETTLGSIFSIFACETLLKYYQYYNEQWNEFLALDNLKPKHAYPPNSLPDYMLTEDFVLMLVCKMISWNYRWYGEYSLLAVQVLKSLMELDDSDAGVVKSKLEVLFRTYLTEEMNEQAKQQQQQQQEQEQSPQKSKLAGAQERLHSPQSISIVVDRYLSWIGQFSLE